MKLECVLATLCLALAACSEDPPPPPPPSDPAPVLTNHVEDWRDEVVYQLLTDRFADGDTANNQGVDTANPVRWHGGDWKGIEQQIPYLQALGVTTVWISPAVKNTEEYAGQSGYHGYWTQDFGATNPHFGTREELRHLVDALHEAGLKVVLDVVTNHVGPLFFYDIDGNGSLDAGEENPAWDSRGILALGSSSTFAPIVWLNEPATGRVAPLPAELQNPDWYNRRGHIVNWDDADQVERGDFPAGLKDLRTSLPEVQESMVRIYRDWMDYDFDGFRVDTLKHVEHVFWRAWARGLREHADKYGKKKFFLFGEAFIGDHNGLAPYTANEEMDGVLNFAQKFLVDEVFKGKSPTRKLDDELKARKVYSREPSPGTGLPPASALVNFFDNHDLPRFLADGSKPEALRAVLGLLLLEEGVPCLYYGTEQDFRGGADPANREDLWTSGYATGGTTFKWVQKLIRARKAYSPLRRGDSTVRWATDNVSTGQDAGLFAVERKDGTRRVLWVVNASGKTSETSASQTGGGDMPTGFPANAELTDALTGDKFTTSPTGTLKLALGAYRVVLLVPTAELVSLD